MGKRVVSYDPHTNREHEDQFADRVTVALTRVADRASRQLGGVITAATAPAAESAVTPPPSTAGVSLTDVAIIGTMWQEVVTAELIPAVGEQYLRAAGYVRNGIQEAFNLFDIPEVSDVFAENYLSAAINRLKGIGDQLWQNARDQLVIGFSQGEGIGKLRDRVQSAAGVTTGRATSIARTEIISASNAGSIGQVRLAGLVGTKEWLATNDARTRLTHRETDGQIVELNAPFSVGGASLDFPGDPTGPPEEIIQCRCSTAFDLDVPENERGLDINVSISPVLTASAEVHTGAMIALRMSENDAKNLALDGFEPIDELHCTVMYLGNVVDISSMQRDCIQAYVADIAAEFEPIQTETFSVNVFNPHTTDRETALVLGVSGGDSQLEELQARLVSAVYKIFNPPVNHTPWIPHVTIAYADDISIIPSLVSRLGPITFDRVRVAFGDEVTDHTLGGSAAVTDYTNIDGGGDIVPWHISENSSHCASDKPYAVVKDATGEVEGCHATRADAVKQLRALYASDSAVATDCPPGQHRMPDGTCMEDSEMPRYSADVVKQTWQGAIAVEDVPTGDGRMFAAGSLGWPDLPIPLMYQFETSHGGGTDRSANVGNITEIWRDGNIIMGRGELDMADAYAQDAARKIAGSFLRGISIDADSVTESDVEFIFPEVSESMTEEEQFAALFAEPELMIFHSARIRGATLVNLPAFVEAAVQLVDASTGTLIAAAVGSHSTATTDDSWDIGVNEKRLDSPMAVGTARKFYAWIDESAVEDGKIPESAGKFGHHMVSADGAPGAANVKACQSGIGILHGGRGGTSIPTSDERGVYNHLAKHIRDAGLEPPPFKVQDVVTAAAYTITIPNVPPAEWFFEEPTELPPIGAIWVTDEGRLFGLVGPSDVAHRAFERRVTIPMGKVDYTRWMNRPTIVEGGDRIATGVITMDCGHMPAHWSDDTEVRMKHYDNSCSIAAVARVVESNKYNAPLLLGAVMPMSPEDFQRFSACQISGDWSPHRDRPGWQEFVAALSVPVPGFARGTSTVRVKSGVLTASSIPIKRYTGSAEFIHIEPEDTVENGHFRAQIDKIRRGLARPNRSEIMAIRDRVRSTQAPVCKSATVVEPKETTTMATGCGPCDKKRNRSDQQTSAQVTTAPGFGEGDAAKAASTSQANAVANDSRIRRG